MPDATYATHLTTFTGLDDLDLTVIGQRFEAHRAVLNCRVLAPDDWCHDSGCQGRPIGAAIHSPGHAPFGWRRTTLHVRVRGYRCTGCGRVWRQNTIAAPTPKQ